MLNFRSIRYFLTIKVESKLLFACVEYIWFSMPGFLVKFRMVC